MTGTVEDKRKEALKAARETRAARRRDRKDRDVFVDRIKDRVQELRPDVDRDAIDITFVGNLSDAVIHIPDPNDPKRKLAYRLV